MFQKLKTGEPGCCAPRCYGAHQQTGQSLVARRRQAQHQQLQHAAAARQRGRSARSDRASYRPFDDSVPWWPCIIWVCDCWAAGLCFVVFWLRCLWLKSWSAAPLASRSFSHRYKASFPRVRRRSLSTGCAVNLFASFLFVSNSRIFGPPCRCLDVKTVGIL